MDSSKKLFKFGDTTREWHYSLDGAEYGPVDEAEVISLIENAEIPPGAPVCRKGGKEWKPAREHACFQVEVNPHRRDTGPDPVSPKSNPPSAANAGGQSSPAPVVPVIHVSGSPAGANPGAESSQPDFDHFFDTCKAFVVQAKARASGKGIAFGIGALLLVCLMLWGTYSFCFGTLSVDGVGEKVFDALVNGDADEYINDCTHLEYSQEKLKKMVRKQFRTWLDQEVEVGKITEGERDRRLREVEAIIDKDMSSWEFAEEDMNGLAELLTTNRTEAKDARERFRRTIEAGMSAGLNWGKAEFEFVDTSEFSTSDFPKDEEDKPPPGFGFGHLYIVISEGGKRYRIEMDDCILVPGYGCLNMDGMYWRGEIK